VYGEAGRARPVPVRRGKAQRGGSRQAWLGMVRQSLVRLGVARLGRARPERPGVTWHGKARRVTTRHGMA
jgi:hypothetical protein